MVVNMPAQKIVPWVRWVGSQWDEEGDALYFKLEEKQQTTWLLFSRAEKSKSITKTHPLCYVPKTRWVVLAEYGREGISVSSRGEITDHLSHLSWKPFVNPVTVTSRWQWHGDRVS